SNHARNVSDGTPRSGPVRCFGERNVSMRANVAHGPSPPVAARSTTRRLRTPSRIRAKAAVWPHMPPPTINTSSSGWPSGPARLGAPGDCRCLRGLPFRKCDVIELSNYYTLSSPWAYFAGPKLQDIVRRHRVKLVLKPFDFQAVVPKTGGIPIRTRPEPRRKYHVLELMRWRDYLG